MSKIMRDRIAFLEDKVSELEERVAQLEAMELGTGWQPPVDLCLTPAEATLLGALVARERCSKEILLEASRTSGLGYRRDEVEPKIVDVFICKLRRKLDPFGIQVRTLWGHGYAIDVADRDRLLNWGREAA